MDDVKATTTIVPDEPKRSRADSIREKLLPDGAFEGEVAEALNCSTRQVQRLGLPFRKFGSHRVYDLPGSREVIRRHRLT